MLVPDVVFMAQMPAAVLDDGRFLAVVGSVWLVDPATGSVRFLAPPDAFVKLPRAPLVLDRDRDGRYRLWCADRTAPLFIAFDRGLDSRVQTTTVEPPGRNGSERQARLPSTAVKEFDMSFRSILAAAAAALCLVDVGASDAQASQSYYTFVNVDTDLCVDVPGFSHQNVLVQQYPCNEGDNQYWGLVDSPYSGWYQIKSYDNGKCLDVPNGSQSNGVQIQQYTCHSGYNQLWYKVNHGGGEFSLVNAASGKCLDAAGDGPGYNLVQWTCHYGDNQRFVYGPYGISVSY